MLYTHLLNGLRSHSQTTQDSAAFVRYLRSLKPSVKEIWQSFQNTSEIEVDYSTPAIQISYLIRYYPSYVKLTHAILKKLTIESISLQKKELRICLFGAGSAPEIIALSKFLSDNFPIVESLKIHIFDIADETWKISRAIAEQYLLPNYWNKRISITSHTLNFCNVDSFLQIQEIVKHSQFFIFQNCLNELDNIEAAIDNIQLLLQSMPSTSHFLMIDLSQYEVTGKVINSIEDFCASLSNFQVEIQEDLKIPVGYDLPDELRITVLDSTPGYIPRSSVKCSFIHVYKETSECNNLSFQQIETLDQQIIDLSCQLEQTQTDWQNEQFRLQSSLDRVQVELNQTIQLIESQSHQSIQLSQAERRVDDLAIQVHHLSLKLRLNRRILAAIALSNALTFALTLFLLTRPSL